MKKTEKYRIKRMSVGGYTANNGLLIKNKPSYTYIKRVTYWAIVVNDRIMDTALSSNKAKQRLKKIKEKEILHAK